MIQCPNRGQVGSAKMWAELALFVPVQFQMRQLSKIYDWQREVKLPKTVHFFNACKLNRMKGQHFWLARSKSSAMHFLFSAFRCFFHMEGVWFSRVTCFLQKGHNWKAEEAQMCVRMEHKGVLTFLCLREQSWTLFCCFFSCSRSVHNLLSSPKWAQLWQHWNAFQKKETLNQSTEFLVHFAIPDLNLKKTLLWCLTTDRVYPWSWLPGSHCCLSQNRIPK